LIILLDLGLLLNKVATDLHELNFHSTSLNHFFEQLLKWCKYLLCGWIKLKYFNYKWH